MWSEFLIGFLGLSLLTFIPGFLIAKACNISNGESICYAPCISIAAYELLSICFALFGIHSTWVSHFFSLLAIGVVSLAITRYIHAKHKSDSQSDSKSSNIKFYALIALYLLCGIGITWIIFLDNIPSADAFTQGYDNFYHLTVPKTFLETGNWSTLNTNLYGPSDGFPAPIEIGYYPAEWHMLVALTSSITGISTIICSNIVLFFIIAIVFPLGTLMLLRHQCAGNASCMAFGSIATFAFAAFPFYGLTFTLTSNVASICLVPIALSALIALIQCAPARRFMDCIGTGIIAIFAIASVGFCHPSAFITVVIAATIFLLCKIAQSSTVGRKIKAYLIIAVLAAIAVVWIVMFNTPLLQAMTIRNGPSVASLSQSIIDVLTFAFSQGHAQLLVGALVSIGFLASLPTRRYRWLQLSFILFAVLYCISAVPGADSTLKGALTGFWYGYAPRVSWNVVIFAIPFLAFGLSFIFDLIKRFAYNTFKTKYPDTILNRCLLLSTLAITACVIFYPNFILRGAGEIVTPFGKAQTEIAAKYNTASKTNSYTPAKRKFIEKAKDIVDPNAAILNVPNDGSFLAYALDDMNIFTRYFNDGRNEQCNALNGFINEYTTSPAVMEAVKKYNIRYVLQLDSGNYGSDNTLDYLYRPERWTGIDAVDENTDGFELVLQDGNMRLFELTERE